MFWDETPFSAVANSNYANTVEIFHKFRYFAFTVETFYSLFSPRIFRLLLRAVNPSTLVFDVLQGRHRDPVMVLGAGPPCQVLRFISARCHKCQMRDEKKRLAEPDGSCGSVSLPYLKEPGVYYRGLRVNLAEVRHRGKARNATATGIRRPLPEGHQFQTCNPPPPQKENTGIHRPNTRNLYRAESGGGGVHCC